MFTKRLYNWFVLIVIQRSHIAFVCYGGFKVCFQIVWHFPLQKVETSSPPLECGLDLVAWFGKVCGRSSSVWLPDLCVKTQCSTVRSRGGLNMREAGWHVMGTVNSLWKGLHGEALRLPANSECNLPAMWVSKLGSTSSDPANLQMSPEPSSLPDFNVMREPEHHYPAIPLLNSSSTEIMR